MIIVDLNDGGLHYTKNKQKSLNIEIKDSYGVSNLSGWYSKSDPGSIEMYIGDSRNSYKYSESDFAMTVAHEFGHALGIGDLYNDSGIPIKFPAMMNNQWEV